MKKKLFCLLMALTMLTTVVLSAETVEIVGYPGVENELITSESQFKITNVVAEDVTTYIPGVKTYICSAPVIVTSLDDLVGFGVSTLSPFGNVYIESTFLIADGYTEEQMFGTETKRPKGMKFTLTKPGTYYVYGNYGIENMSGAEAVIIIEDGAAETIKADYTDSKVLVNGEEVKFEAYNIHDNNYFKLRDLAYVLSGTEKQFEVVWDEELESIYLTSNSPYTVVGGELAPGDGQAKMSEENKSPIYKDGASVYAKAYTINDNNYFKLRDICRMFDVGVIWSEEANTISIDTSIPYTD